MSVSNQIRNLGRAIPFVAVALLSLSGATRALADPDGSWLLRRMAQSEESVSYWGSITISGRAQASATIRLWRKGNLRRLEYIDPPIRRGDLVVADGHAVYTYHRAENAAVQTRVGGGRINWPRLRSQFAIRTLGQERMAGRPAWIVGMFALNDGRLLRKVWIDEGYYARLRVVRFGRQGGVLEDLTTTEIHFVPVDDNRFVWQAPPGARVQISTGINYATLAGARQAAPWMQFPHNPPEGYAFESAVIGGGNSWLRYSNGVTRFSLFQEQAAGEPDAPVQAHGEARFWKRAGCRFLLVGLPAEQVDVVIASIR